MWQLDFLIHFGLLPLEFGQWTPVLVYWSASVPVCKRALRDNWSNKTDSPYSDPLDIRGLVLYQFGSQIGSTKLLGTKVFTRQDSLLAKSRDLWW